MSIETFTIDETTTPAKIARLAFGSLINSAGGILAAGGLEVTQKGTPDMHVIINGGTPGEGAAWVPGFTVSTGPYYFYNTADFELAIPASNETNPRIETIVARIKDKAVEGTGHEGLFEALKGTAEAGATLANRKGAAVVPKGCYVLGYVLVPAKATSIKTAEIENVAVPFTIGAGNTHISWGRITGTTTIVGGTGDFTVAYLGTGEKEFKWTKEKPNANYGVVAQAGALGGTPPIAEVDYFGLTAKAFRIKTYKPSFEATDCDVAFLVASA